LNISAKYHQNW